MLTGNNLLRCVRTCVCVCTRAHMRVCADVCARRVIQEHQKVYQTCLGTQENIQERKPSCLCKHTRTLNSEQNKHGYKGILLVIRLVNLHPRSNAFLEEMLCAKCVSWHQGTGSRTRGFPYRDSAKCRDAAGLSQCDRLSGRGAPPREFTQTPHHGTPRKYIKLEIRQISRCQKRR